MKTKESKRLVWQNEISIEQRKQFTTQLVENCNSVLESFKTDWNLFEVPIDEANAWGLVGDPVKFFDDLLLQNSPIKPFGNVRQNPAKLAELTGIDREGRQPVYTQQGWKARNI
jgi:hypothetical protein